MNETDELVKLRAISRECADLPIVQEYIKNCANFTYGIMKELGYNPDESYNRKTQDKFNNYDIGFVPPESIRDMLTGGNLREHATFTIAIILSEPGLCSHLLVKKNKGETVMNVNFESPTLQKILDRIKTFTGLSEKAIFELFDQCEKPQYSCNINKLSGTPIVDSTIMSRYTGFPIGKPSRATRTTNEELYRLTPEIIYPPLGEREIQYLKDKRGYIDSDELPIKSGGILFQVNEETYFNDLCVNYNEFAVCGPSTSIDAMFHILSLLPNWNLEIFVLMTVAYMCNTPDHSLIELLLPSREYGLNYKVDDDGGTYTFVRTLLEKYKPKGSILETNGGCVRTSIRTTRRTMRRTTRRTMRRTMRR